MKISVRPNMYGVKGYLFYRYMDKPIGVSETINGKFFMSPGLKSFVDKYGLNNKSKTI